MAKFQEPGFKTRIEQAQRAKLLEGMRPDFPNTAECMKPVLMGKRERMLAAYGAPRKGGLTDFLFGELKDLAREINKPAPRKPGKIAAVNKWEEFDTHKPRGFNSPFNSPEKYMERLKKHGFRCIGSGAYSAVFRKGNSDRVIKVCRRADTDAYPMFAEWAHKHPSPYLPVIHSFQRHERHVPFYVVVLDRYKQTVDSMCGREGWQDATRIIWEYARRQKDEPTSILKTSIRGGVFQALPGLKQVIDAFVEEFDGIAFFDMHDGNWMITEGGQLVMIDPLSGATSDRATERNKRVSRIKASVRLAA